MAFSARIRTRPRNRPNQRASTSRQFPSPPTHRATETMDEQKNHPAPPPHSERRSPTSQASTPPPSASQPRRRRLVWIVVVVLIVAGLFAWHPWNRGSANNPQQQAGGGRRGGGPGGPGGPGMPAPPQPVHVATVTQGEMPVVINSLGTVTPLASVTVKTLLNGTLQDVAFQEGQMVRKGDVLAQIDPRPYEISLRNAQGTLAKDQALLQTARL